MAVRHYHSAQDHLPIAHPIDEQGRSLPNWRIELLRYVEQDDLYRKYVRTEPWNSANNGALAPHIPRTYRYPSEKREEVTVASYVAVVGEETVWPGQRKKTLDEVKDDNTILIVENYGANIHWMEPRDLVFGPAAFRINDPQGISSRYKLPAVAMLDGSVRTLNRQISPTVLRALLTANGKEIVREDTDDWQVIEDGRKRELADP